MRHYTLKVMKWGIHRSNFAAFFFKETKQARAARRLLTINSNSMFNKIKQR